jgi:hypothetical protein
MAEPVTVVVSGGVPVVDATPLSGTALTNPTTYGVPVTPVESGARPVTIVASGAPPIVFIAENGVDYLLGGSGGSPVVVPDAPVLIWTSLATESDPTFDVLLDTPLVGDTIYLQIDDNALFSSPAEYTNTIDAGEAVAMAVQFTGFTLLADGTWYARAKHNTSDWSNTETKTIAAATGPAVGDGLLLDNGTDFLLLDNGDFLLLS